MTTREYAKNLFSQWSDEDFCDQPIFDKLFFQVLNGQRAVNAAGIQPINFTRWRKAMRDGDRLPAVEDLQAALVRMERRGYVFTDEDAGEVLIRSRIRRDELDKQPTMFLAALRILAVIDSPKFAAVLATELNRMDVPDVKGDKDYAKRLRDSLNQTYVTARTHLKTLADGYPQPFPEPFEGVTPGPSHGPSTRPSPGGSAGPSPRPGETGPTPGPSPRPTQGPSGSGSGSGSLTSLGGYVGERARAAETADTEPNGPRNDPPIAAAPPDDTDDPEPPRRCKTHRALPADAEIPDCPHCGHFRKAHERWTERHRTAHAQAQSAAAHARAALIAEAIHACDLCDPDGYVHGSTHIVCNHNPAQADTNARGMAAVRAALTTRTTTTDPAEEAQADA
ncbi:hypothetical protein [Mycobacterium aquaticum]|uniref:Uncharacterized protein n=1 Tax=Mycobacterium aquaticum TaxID=1927124 RepID=A0A1X0B6Z4_9MYCO|nr:hypothetical protein [Mycobacterium aquaticum]ORA38090.1 hypothetical protein BST13_05700 [Mycobacterium aquaticum]